MLNEIVPADVMANLRLLMIATRDAKSRTGDDAVSTRVKQGKIQICRVTYATAAKRGRSTVTPLTEYMPMADAIAHLNAM